MQPAFKTQPHSLLRRFRGWVTNMLKVAYARMLATSGLIMEPRGSCRVAVKHGDEVRNLVGLAHTYPHVFISHAFACPIARVFKLSAAGVHKSITFEKAVFSICPCHFHKTLTMFVTPCNSRFHRNAIHWLCLVATQPTVPIPSKLRVSCMPKHPKFGRTNNCIYRDANASTRDHFPGPFTCSLPCSSSPE
jgi:hypothetical protein